MDAVFKSIKCDTSLPVWVMDNTFAFTCDDNVRCRFAQGAVARVSGKLVLNGYNDYAEEDTQVALVGGLDTLTDRYKIDQVVDMCNLNYAYYVEQEDDDDAAAAAGDDYNYGNDDAYNDDDGENDDFYDANAVYGDDDAVAYYNDDAANDDAAAAGDDYYNGDDTAAVADDYYNGDDAYGDDAVVYDDYYNGDDDGNNRIRFLDDCPADGVYEFNTHFKLPTGKWMATGWGATADLRMFAHDGTKLGQCELTFQTKPTSIVIVPAKFVMMSLVVTSGIALFFIVYYLIKREALCNSCNCNFEQFVDSNGDGVYKNMADDEEDFTTDDEGGYTSTGEMMESSDERVPKASNIGTTAAPKGELDAGILA